MVGERVALKHVHQEQAAQTLGQHFNERKFLIGAFLREEKNASDPGRVAGSDLPV